MKRNTALAIITGFAALGWVAAGWGAYDILRVRAEMKMCAHSVEIDTSAFYFLGLVSLPLFMLLPFVRDSFHTSVLAITVAVALGVPGLAYVGFTNATEMTGYQFSPEMTLFGLQTITGSVLPSCASPP